ncbi:ABC transporter [Tepiditoga spiralis]|uniref:ABC transporter n=1 Tax=Tepiditoga spiralis TaxID=2108365 RepID=A0A7G1G4T2_9BACT|nr:ABC transporter ATP-binding protein [Tepiditoga spiralis]BBE31548.1 ABC transporter [Tepiditoga spiralis]
MTKLFRYLKPFAFIILLAILFVSVRSLSDLALPDYMSKIVNVGIQQNGIENSVPIAIRKSTVDKLSLFLSTNEKKELSKNYIYIDKTKKEYAIYLKKYPILKKEPIYVLKNNDSKTLEPLKKIFGKGFLAIEGIEKLKENEKDGFIDLNGTKIPAKLNIYSFLSFLPETQRIEMANSMNEKFTSLGDNMVNQAAVSYLKKEYDAVGINTSKLQSKYIINTGLFMLLLSLLSGISTILVGFLAAKTAAGVAKNLRRDVFSKVQKFSNAEFDKFSTSSLITRTTNDITQIQQVVFMIIRILFYAPIIGIGGVFKALQKSASMSWIIALAVLVLLGLILIVFSVAFPKFKIVQKLIDKLNLVARENLSGLMVIRAFNTQKFEEKRFDKANLDLTNVSLFVNRIMVVMMPAMMLIMNGVSILIVWVGAHQIANSSMQVGDMMAFMQYAMQIIFSFLMLAIMFIMVPRASVSGQRIAKVLETDASIKDPENPKNLDEAKGEIEFKNVSFKYNGAEENMLKNITFKAKPKQTTAIVGSTGSGKTTLINLILRFYDATEGEILIDGINIKDLKQSELRKQIGYVPQKGILFSGTIKSNLKYANENSTDEDIVKTAKIAQAMEFIEKSPKKFDTEISQGGSNVSGGQKQRLSIARTILKKPKIYIFDDSFSALDFKTAAQLKRDLKEETKNSTVIIVAQRISTVKNSDQIIVLDEGKIVGIGTHDYLMKNCVPYQEIALSQLSREELA